MNFLIFLSLDILLYFIFVLITNMIMKIGDKVIFKVKYLIFFFPRILRKVVVICRTIGLSVIITYTRSNSHLLPLSLLRSPRLRKNRFLSIWPWKWLSPIFVIIFVISTLKYMSSDILLKENREVYPFGTLFTKKFQVKKLEAPEYLLQPLNWCWFFLHRIK